MKQLLILPFLFLFINCSITEMENEEMKTYSNLLTNERMLLVLSAPSVHDTYYAKAFQNIVDFQIAYAQSILGNDNVIIIVDKDTRPYFENALPEDILLTSQVDDIWMRDFTTVNPLNPIQFTYTWASMTKKESEQVQGSFQELADIIGIQRKKSDLLLDGGNLVDNYSGKLITTTRFLEDNRLGVEEGKEYLKSAYGASEVAILPPDEDVLAHSDGMVSWIDDDVLLVNDYSTQPGFRKAVLEELNKAFPAVKILEAPVQYKENPPGEWFGFSSACGVNLNATLTFNNLYVPAFNMTHDQKVISIIEENTSKKVITVNAEGVCPMGGSVRCLTWQLAGDNAKKLILAARNG